LISLGSGADEQFLALQFLLFACARKPSDVASISWGEIVLTRRALTRVGAGIAGAASLSAVVLAATAGTASAADGVQAFRNDFTHQCLTGYGHGAPYGGDCGSEFAHWRVHSWRDGTKEIREADSHGFNLCLDDSARYGLRNYPCNATPFQSWYVEHHADGSFALRNQSTGWYVTDVGNVGSLGDTALPGTGGNPFQSWL
jgi:hypothetical protein